MVKSEIQFTKSLVRGAEGDEVKQLQEVLAKDSDISTTTSAISASNLAFLLQSLSELLKQLTQLLH